MGNKHRGEISVEVDGKSVPLRMNFNAMCELEGVSGLSMQAIIDELQDFENLSAVRVRQVFWALMLDARPISTLRDAGHLIDSLHGRQSEILFAAFEASFPDAQEGDQEGK